ncbi:sex pilus assembly and synthesis protein (plasmid) [Pseudomonas veronii 1YdBTEX2]|uniref:Type-F conjugative transfer system protein TraW n=2 Tax=Pseudomonas veronii TaxID=76761 RepID=A0A7Y1AB83_PSEVE|nr:MULTISPECIES: type-F conjugative transfer system protein TraW [Pseudomonas]SBW85302.1 sex pilus assembly and synthesis protein [Pseudomonas veronii 1YdBTEX2]KAA0945923.1 type-F conjugative transfer system protein TraW [Pseudomonas sp. ANT_H14]KAA0946247.1 type-F conjugative transfer system protein TraW [Pseudomonas sp. ANT_H4]MBI6557355.1 type-F conjugative transfer system protein TraW [Pseudomonas veronii]MBI6653583.1 type-F conjugative transfer system protein TraW [Pseudomonas veronii]
MKLRRLCAFAFVPTLILTSFNLHAEQLGQYGNTWNIQEQDAIDMIKGRLGEMEKRGELTKYWNDYRDTQLAGLENPKPLPGIEPVVEPQIRMFDPTYTYAETVKDHLGNVLVPAGTKINPLDYTPLSKAIIFIDGRDPKQLAYAKQRTEEHPRDKVILVAGSFLKLNREWGRPVYFDQQGILTKKFGIERVPAVLTQNGRQLQIEELKL